MAAESPEDSALKPVTPARVAKEIEKISAARRSGELSADNYDQKFARMIQELRERRIEGGRAEITAALKPLLDQGKISLAESERLLKQLGITK